MFALTHKPIDIAAIRHEVAYQAAGAVVTFDGRVRDHNEGHSVERLEYQIYETLAQKEGEAILAEAKARFAIHLAAASHRGGLLELEDCAVYVAVSSSHRREAFEACQYIIDEIKHRLPIWKKEHYSSPDRPAEWVNCHRCAAAAASAPKHTCRSHSHP